MFTNRYANEINIRVVFYGPGLVGKTTLMQRIYDTTPESQKGKIVSLQTETERTVFYDLQRPDFPEVEGARVLPDELEFATKEGTPALLEKMNLAKRGKDFGWGRKPRKSVLRKGFLSGLFT